MLNLTLVNFGNVLHWIPGRWDGGMGLPGPDALTQVETLWLALPALLVQPRVPAGTMFP